MTDHSCPGTIPLRGLLPLGLAVYAFACVYSLNKPLTTDEVEFAAAAQAIGRTGRPIYYLGDTPEQYVPAKDRWQMREAPAPGQQYGLWHPPLYIYWLALFLKVFGPANWAARLANVVLFLLTLGLLRGIVRQLVPREHLPDVFGLVAFLYLINPLLIQQGLMLDLDNTVVALSGTLFLHQSLRCESPLPRKYAWLTVLMALCFWAKELSGVFLALALLVYALGRRQWREAVAVVAMTIAGTALFWVSWWLFCRLTGLPVMYFIRFSILGKLALGEGLLTTIAQQEGWGFAGFNIVFSLFNTLIWVSAFYVALAAGVIGWRTREFWRTRRPAPLDLLWLYALIVLLVTQVYRPSGWFLKYEYPAHVILVVVVGAFLAEHCQRLAMGGFSAPAEPPRSGGSTPSGPPAGRPVKPPLRGGFPTWLILAALGVAAVQVLTLGDPVDLFYNVGLTGFGDARVWSLYGGTAIVLYLVCKLTQRGWSATRIGGTVLVVGLVGANLGQDWVQRAPYTTSINWRNYGEAGFSETVACLNSVLGPDAVPICRKDIGFHLAKDAPPGTRRWYNLEVLADATSDAERLRNISLPGVAYIVVPRGAVSSVWRQHCDVEREFGSFTVLRRRAP